VATTDADPVPDPSRPSGLRALLPEFADLPLGHIVFVLIAVGGLAWIRWGTLKPSEYFGAVSAASGLVAVGHGIRHHRRP
jgi:hypothetical protein